MSLSRAGQLHCECAALTDDAAAGASAAGARRLAAGFGLSVLAQSLVLTALPAAAQILAPRPVLAGVPYALWLLGSLAATFPASLLDGLFGRRSAFALGSSLGLAGGLLAAWGFQAAQFSALMLGAFWLGLAQGFGLYYRHAALRSGGRRGLALLLAAGAASMVLAPASVTFLTWQNPLGTGRLFLGAGAISLIALALALTLPPSPVIADETPPARVSLRLFLGTGLAGAFAWFVMTRMMGAAPGMLIGCGLGLATTTSFIAWHMLAMYVPSALMMSLSRKVQPRAFILAGTAALIAALLLSVHGQILPVGLALTCAGLGWSLATSGAMLALYARGQPARGVIAAQDAFIFLGAVLGALA